MHTIIDRTRPLIIKTTKEADFKLDDVEDEENVGPSFIIETQSNLVIKTKVSFKKSEGQARGSPQH
jgi:hypothetical protein